MSPRAPRLPGRGRSARGALAERSPLGPEPRDDDPRRGRPDDPRRGQTADRPHLDRTRGRGAVGNASRRAHDPDSKSYPAQDVCPWNVSFAQELKTRELEPRAVLRQEDTRALARELLAMDDAGFREKFRGSPMKRAKLPGLKRNAAVVLGNVGEAGDVPILEAAMREPDALVREHAAWALERIGSVNA